MNILFLAHRVPYPPNKGDKIRSFNEIKFLSRKHRISLLCLADDPKDFQYDHELKKYCCSVDIVFLPAYHAKLRSLLYLFSKTPLSLPYFFSKELQSIVFQRLRENMYDLIFVYSSSMAQYVEDVEDIPKVIDFVDVDSEKWAQYALHAKFPYTYVYRLESQRLRKYEEFIARTFQHSFFVSPKEVEDFRNFVPQDVAITSIANGIDNDIFQPSPEPYNPNTLVFTGAMDYFANVETMLYFSQEILPLIQETIPDVRLYIVGSNPSPEIKKLAENHSNIIVTGYVDQVQSYVLKSAVFVAPMRIARGVQNKILEAMAMGVPVVTSSLGLEGIPAMSGKDIFVEDQPDRFARQVIQLMTDAELRKTVSLNARKVIEENCNWDKKLEKLEKILLELVNP